MFANIGSKITEIVVLSAPAAQGAGGADLAGLATTIQTLLTQIMTVGYPVLLIAGGLMIGFSGVNPQWKQKGIETIKWSTFGLLFMLIGAGALAIFVNSMATS